MMKQNIQLSLNVLKQIMREQNLWEVTPPSQQALASTLPFALDQLSPTQWLQWIFIPKMEAILDTSGHLPKNVAISPYLEESLKEETYLPLLLAPIFQLEKQLNSQEC